MVALMGTVLELFNILVYLKDRNRTVMYNQADIGGAFAHIRSILQLYCSFSRRDMQPSEIWRGQLRVFLQWGAV